MNNVMCVVTVVGFIFCILCIAFAIASSCTDAKGEIAKENKALRDAIRRAEREEGMEGK